VAHPLGDNVAHSTFRTTFFRALVAVAFAGLATTAHAVFVGGNFDPPDLSGTHTFSFADACLHSGSYTMAVNNDGPCTGSLTRLTVLLDHSFPLNFSGFLPFFGITSILVLNGQVAGVDTDLIGPVTVGGEGPYVGSWWIQYRYNNPFIGFAFDPVDLFRNCTTRVSPNCVVDTASVVTFFPSDANGNPLTVPEPDTLILILAGLGAGWAARRKLES
jgi:hypothetical protein